MCAIQLASLATRSYADPDLPKSGDWLRIAHHFSTTYNKLQAVTRIGMVKRETESMKGRGTWTMSRTREGADFSLVSMLSVVADKGHSPDKIVQIAPDARSQLQCVRSAVITDLRTSL